ncbi:MULTISPECIES: ParB N-terminal domain-containing protein [Streptomyces]|uniref:ParB N-terminal domain-containing protein n=1 Tax=Streptomyces TaxID=1883 RepID=UPI0022588894|nr:MULTISPECIES: ParB N-terminal domain-containing protein [Streptomyces]MCX5278349.1 ParB N-terminal domain-containing protein [Streptomyces virginiae]MCX5582992.1 ParB N-terminal domain-containing protein [Streptomyces erythrochromogenes]
MENNIELHPTTALFPMLDEEEIQALADDIREHGLDNPVVLDSTGRVLDGKNRLRACEIAGVEPDYATYDGDDTRRYVLSANKQRRNLTKGQLAMITAKACSFSEHEQRPLGEQSVRSLSEQSGVSTGRIGQASMVLRHAPDLADAVINGTMGLNEAYSVAQKNKAQAESAEAQLARLRSEDPQLADRVAEGELTIQGAWAERKARQEEDLRQRRVATNLLCEILPALAQIRGSRTFAQYDPELAPPGRAVTHEVIEHAATALTEIAAVWKERNLP